MIFKSDYFNTLFGFVCEVANHSFILTLCIKINCADIFKHFTVVSFIILAKHLVTAANCEHNLTHFNCTLNCFIFTFFQIFKQNILLKILTAADKKNIIIIGIKRFTHSDFIHLGGNTAKFHSFSQSDNITPITVEIKHIRIKVCYFNHHSQKSLPPSLLAITGRIVIIEV